MRSGSNHGWQLLRALLSKSRRHSAEDATVMSSFHTVDRANGTGGYESVISPWRGMKAQRTLKWKSKVMRCRKKASSCSGQVLTKILRRESDSSWFSHTPQGHTHTHLHESIKLQPRTVSYADICSVCLWECDADPQCESTCRLSQCKRIRRGVVVIDISTVTMSVNIFFWTLTVMSAVCVCVSYTL